MEDKNIMSFTDENGNTIDYELLDIVEYNEKTYVVLYPTIPGDTEVIILRVEESDNPDESIYIPEPDEYTVNKVYALFKEKYKDEIKFEDN